MVITEEKVALKRFAKERNILGPKRTEFNVPYSIEYSLINLFKQELELKRKIQGKLNELQKREDFFINDIFRVLDFFSNGYINEEK